MITLTKDVVSEQVSVCDPHIIVQLVGGEWEHLNADAIQIDHGVLHVLRRYPSLPDAPIRDEQYSQMVATYGKNQWRQVRSSEPSTWLDRSMPTQYAPTDRARA